MKSTKKTAKKRTRKPAKSAVVKPQENSQEGMDAFCSEKPPTIDDWRREAEYLQQRIDTMNQWRERQDKILAGAALGLGCTSLRPETVRGALIVALGTLQIVQAEVNVHEQLRSDALKRLEEQSKRAELATLEKKKLLAALTAWAKDYFAEGDPAREWLQSTLGVNFTAAASEGQE